MSQRIFLSYSQPDKSLAERICAAIEQAGHSCWIAPRDIPAGTIWAAAIIDAINNCDRVLLIFSTDSNASTFVMREMDLAVTKHKPIVVVRLQDELPSGPMEFYLATSQWLDVFDCSDDQLLSEVQKTISAPVSTRLPTLTQLVEQFTPLESQLAQFIERGITTLDSITGQLIPEGNLNAAQIGRVFDTAIQFGAEVYNHKSPEGCATIYSHACRKLYAILHDSDATTRPSYVTQLLQQLPELFDKYPEVTARNADAFAWKLRHVFDHFHVFRGIEDVNKLFREIQKSGGLNIESVTLVIRVAIQHGNVLYQTEDLFGCAELHSHTANEILTSLAEHPPTSDRLLRIGAELSSILQRYEDVTAENADAQAWALFNALAGVLNSPSR